MATQLDASFQGGGWFLESDFFLKWTNGANRLLWCSGTFGVGKTVLASIVASHLRNQKPEVGVAAVYLKHNEPRQNCNYILKSILGQLVEESDATGGRPLLSETILPAFQAYSKVFLIVDAIDECEAETGRDLIELLQGLSLKIHLMVTSYEQPSANGFQHVRVKADQEDIRLYIDQRIQGDKNLQSVVQDCPEIRNNIKKAVVEAAGDSFLLARLHMESLVLAAALSIQGVNMELRNLPSTIPDAYYKAIERVEEELKPVEKEIVLKALLWISHAYRALSLEELQHALATGPDGISLDEKYLVDGDSITALSGGLVVVSEAGVVSLVHRSAKVFIERCLPRHHMKIALSCAAYLNALKDSNHETLEKYHLAKYAADYMGNHAERIQASNNPFAETISEFLRRSDEWNGILSLLDGLDLLGRRYSNTDSPAQTNVTPARNCRKVQQLAASIGVAHAVIMLLKETANTVPIVLEELTFEINTYGAARERGFAAAIAFLIGNGGRVDLRDDHGVQVFLAAVSRGWRDVADLIFQNANSADGSQVSPDRVQLLLAAYDGNKARTEGSVDLIKQDRGVGATALFIAVERDHLDIVRILLSAGVDINSKDSIGQTALYRATRRGSEVMVRMLLDNGAGVNIKDDQSKTAWSGNAHTSNNKTLSLLLEARADPDTTGPDGVSLLYIAASSGDQALVSYLIQSGANPSIKTKYKWTPLHWAAGNGHLGCVKLLIRAGAELSPLSDTLLTPLDLAYATGIVDLLEMAGAKRALDITDSVKQAVIKDAVPNSTAHTDSEAKTTLVFDRPMNQKLSFGQFVYHMDGRSGCYEISKPLDTKAGSISISYSRSNSRPGSSEYPLRDSHFNPESALYEIKATQPKYWEFEIRDCTKPDTFIMRISGGNWEIVHHKTKAPYLYATFPDWTRAKDSAGWRWVDRHGKLVARAEAGEAPGLILEHGLDPTLRDSLVACHVAKIWFEMAADYEDYYQSSQPPCWVITEVDDES
ncbi:MAG: hypothetical protein M1840_006966 [Geoglossum simile]|nr:MAG: hypothetical protein M1840_006966 [Geoglossum simile]